MPVINFVEKNTNYFVNLKRCTQQYQPFCPLHRKGESLQPDAIQKVQYQQKSTYKQGNGCKGGCNNSTTKKGQPVIQQVIPLTGRGERIRTSGLFVPNEAR